MTDTQYTPHRRIVLGSLLTGISTSLAGCSTVSNSGETEPTADSGGEIIHSSEMVDLDLVIELERDAVDQLNVVAPSGELFARRTIGSGVSRTMVKVGTDYPPGEYELIGLSDGQTVETTSITLEPELEISELRLGRDHPEAMYDGASDSETEAEAILSVANRGTGPTAATALRFEGDVPFPTHESYDEVGKSGIYDPEDEFEANAELIPIPAGETVLLYSSTRPFSPASTRSKCNSVGRNGRFTVRLFAAHDEENLALEYMIHYLETDSDDCDVEIEELS
ncbi:hypothetical protein [Natrinema salinisoli]|uniref:hypothetical protein n=1 Tax=Natrinema salinisoli TaxID=2878535 RepID=UPI001CF06168|nr:hypothetical protein [Natrinema salinisoli]